MQWRETFWSLAQLDVVVNIGVVEKPHAKCRTERLALVEAELLAASLDVAGVLQEGVDNLARGTRDDAVVHAKSGKNKKSETGVRQGLGDVRSLLAYLASAAPSYYYKKLKSSSDDDSVVRITQFSHGQSNPTYVLRWPGSSTGLVVRKQPAGKLLKGAHDVGREHAVAKALGEAGVATPRAVAYCDDPSVIGTEFWCYEYCEGRHFADPYLEGAPVSERPELLLNAARAAAAIHRATPSPELRARLSTHLGGYLGRQVRTWRRQYEAADARLGEHTSPEILELAALLEETISARPEVDEGEFACVAHGDLRTDNMIYDSKSSKVVSILDWELATVGHPLSDLAYLAMPYAVPPVPFGPISGFRGLDLEKHGIPTREALVAAYVDEIKDFPQLKEVVDRAIPRLDLFAAVGYFRLSGIARGVYARAKLGNASAANAMLVGSMATTLSRVSRGLVVGASRRRHYSVDAFVKDKVIPTERDSMYRGAWEIPPEIEALKAEAKSLGLWNLFFLGKHPDKPETPYQLASSEYPGGGLSLLSEYAPLCEAMGQSLLAPEVFNCSAPDTGNMEVIAQFGTQAQKQKWLLPLLDGTIRSCYAMTEPEVASSDATNLRATVRDDGDGRLVLDGRKWWVSGAMDPRCRLSVFLGKAIGETVPSDAPKHARHSMVLVPMDKVSLVRPLPVFGFDDAPHGHAEILFDNVVVDKSEAMLLGHGRGFEIAQARLGPGRVHHSMRAIGACERALRITKERIKSRVAFGKPLADHGTIMRDIADARIAIDQARHLVHHCARAIDAKGNKAARKDIAMIKVAVPQMACRVLDSLIQMWGGAGLASPDTPLAHFYAQARVLRLADGPDEVHLQTIAKMELKDT
ncbi:hypothetical protein CTAYLR_007311 [Chrysophaeum taylorii]|uniref:Acyl-CoA dehydrogenase family member 11 n=1 Tax=Chrysophaeum taylorii TaxID=2483200 RepID=A0AAD7U742_9STRA|nr:hypothetical protein CTAYLR_007311 [Chrysophaeum taylorii]